MRIDHIGNYTIIAPDQPMLDFWDGIELAETEINPLINVFLEHNINIYFLIPEERPTVLNGKRTLNDSFAIGLLEEFIKKVRDARFPELKFQAARDKIRSVQKTPHLKNDSSLQEHVINKLQDVFHTSWETYDPLEQYLKGRLTFGIQHKDGSITLPEYSAERVLKPIGDETLDEKMRAWMHVFHKSLDCMFMGNLEQSAQIKTYPEYARSAPEHNP